MINARISLKTNKFREATMNKVLQDSMIKQC